MNNGAAIMGSMPNLHNHRSASRGSLGAGPSAAAAGVPNSHRNYQPVANKYNRESNIYDN